VAYAYVCVFCQLIVGDVAHAYACVCVLAADWWLGGLCICMCVCSGSRLVRRWLMHMHVCVFWQLIGG